MHCYCYYLCQTLYRVLATERGLDMPRLGLLGRDAESPIVAYIEPASAPRMIHEFSPSLVGSSSVAYPVAKVAKGCATIATLLYYFKSFSFSPSFFTVP